jgi:hypothetical protein
MNPEMTASSPYLDRISISGHYPQPGADAPWKKLLVQPVSIPSLSHTGIKCAFSTAQKDYTRPDGSISTELRSTVSSGVRSYPRVKSKDITLRQPLELGGGYRVEEDSSTMASTGTQIVNQSDQMYAKAARKKGRKGKGFGPTHQTNDPSKIKTYASLKAALLANV